MKRLPSFLLLFGLVAISLLFIITCKKEYSYEGGRAADYTFIGSPDSCTGAIVYGVYYTGLPLDFNSVEVGVWVQTPGNYDLATNQVDGFSFSGSGVFTDTGKQYIRLQPTGIPTAAGDFSLQIPGTKGCYFTVSVIDKPDAIFALAGAPGACEQPLLQGTYQKGKAMTAANTVSLTINVTATGHYTAFTTRSNGITFSATGEFTTLGEQQLLLTAAGTPDNTDLSHFEILDNASICGFDVPVTNAEPVATYVLQSAYNNGGFYCTPGSVQGTYTAGTPLSSSNTLTVNAYVTVPGNYTIATTEINGMKFIYTGTFTTIGAQDVVLKGSGTPTGIGTFTFTPQIVGPAPLGGETCGLDVEVK